MLQPGHPESMAHGVAWAARALPWTFCHLSSTNHQIYTTAVLNAKHSSEMKACKPVVVVNQLKNCLSNWRMGGSHGRIHWNPRQASRNRILTSAGCVLPKNFSQQNTFCRWPVYVLQAKCMVGLKRHSKLRHFGALKFRNFLLQVIVAQEFDGGNCDRKCLFTCHLFSFFGILHCLKCGWVAGKIEPRKKGFGITTGPNKFLLKNFISTSANTSVLSWSALENRRKHRYLR